MKAGKKIFFFLLVTWVVDFSVGLILKKLYFSLKSNQYFRTTYTIREVKKDVIILGSSRANRHYSDDVITKALHKSYYNAGVDGEFLIYSYAMFHGVTARYNPGLIILDITPHALSELPANTTNITSLRPYYAEDIFYRDLGYSVSLSERWKNISGIFPYNNKLFSILSGNTYSNAADTIGYFPLEGAIDTNVVKSTPATHLPNSPLLENLFEQFMQTAKSKNINLVVVVSPIFYKPESAMYSIKTIGEITNKTGIPFFDFSADTMFLGKKDFFYDNDHLNKKGSVVFSDILINRLLNKR